MEKLILVSLFVTTALLFVAVAAGNKSISWKLVVAGCLQGAIASSFFFVGPVAGHVALLFVFIAMCTTLAFMEKKVQVTFVGEGV